MTSSPEYQLELSQEAYDDLISIQNYTYSAHGENQLNKYEALLDKAMQHMLNYPISGHERDDIPNGYLAWNVGEHVMIYRIDEPIIYLVRVLHGRMDFTFQF